jgi:hypothetical protein
MKKLFLALLLTSTAHAGVGWDSPTEYFDASKNRVDEITVKWVVTEDVQKVCERESRNRGYKGFGYAVNACSFWLGNQCTIVTSKRVNMHTLGHETRHCFQGNWH